MVVLGDDPIRYKKAILMETTDSLSKIICPLIMKTKSASGHWQLVT
jgi:hypothetical protein